MVRQNESLRVKRDSLSFYGLISSSTTQLEFFTLIGVIFNAFMQGFIAVNSIYTFLLQDITVPPAVPEDLVEDDEESNKGKSKDKAKDASEE